MTWNRREFMQKGSVAVSTFSILGLTGCTCQQISSKTAPHSTCCSTPNLETESLTKGENRLSIDLSKALSLREVGNAAYIVDSDRPLQIVVVHASRDEYFALSRLCTHGNQVLSYNRQRGILQCNSYNHSIFDLEGEIVKGPAEIPLRTYPVTLTNGVLEILL